MAILLRFSNGRRVEALVLSANPDRMRILARRGGDTLELHRDGLHWRFANGHRVEIDCVLHDGSAVAPPYETATVPETAWWQGDVQPGELPGGQWSTM